MKFILPNDVLQVLRDFTKEQLEDVLAEIDNKGINVSGEVKEYMIKELQTILANKSDVRPL